MRMIPAMPAMPPLMGRCFPAALRVAAFLLAPAFLCTHADARPLRWAVDPTGGAPYAFADPDHPESIIGFEVELVERIAEHLGQRLHEPVGVEVVRGDYARLAGLVDRGDADLALNGLEEKAMARLGARTTPPYYVAAEVWTLRADGSPVPDARTLPGLAVGTIPGTFAESLLREGGAEVKTYDGGQGEIFDDLLLGRSAAALIDEPVARYYGAVRQGLRLAPSTFATTRYVGVVRGDAFADAISASVSDVLASGEAASLFSRWGLLSKDTRALCTVPTSLPEPSALAHWDEAHRAPSTAITLTTMLVRAAPTLARALGTTVFISLMSMVGAVALGSLLAVASLARSRVLRFASRAYVEMFRGTPLFIQLTVIYFGLPQLGVTLAPFTAGVLGLSLNYAASESENIRSGFLGVPAGLVEAARVLGLSRRATLRHLIAPLALRGALPPMTNDFLALLKDSALVSIVTVTELTRAYMTLATATGAFLEMGIVIAAIYLLAGLPFVVLARRLESSLGKRMRTLGDSR